MRRLLMQALHSSIGSAQRVFQHRKACPVLPGRIGGLSACRALLAHSNCFGGLPARMGGLLGRAGITADSMAFLYVAKCLVVCAVPSVPCHGLQPLHP